MNRRTHDIPLKLKSVSSSGEFSGYGSVFGVEDSYSDIVVKGAFTKSLDTWKNRDALPAMLWQHKMSEPIGIYTKMEEDDNGLYVEGRLLVDDDPLAKRAHAHMKAGSMTGLSIGYILNDWEYDKEKDVFLLKEIDVWEVSPVTFPSNHEARVHDVKTALTGGEVPHPSLVEKCLRDAGFSRKQAKTILSGGYKALRDAVNDDGQETVDQLKQFIANIKV